jgi:hypothetical protein
MADLKRDLSSSLQRARESGKLHSDKLREIVRDAVSRAVAEVKEGSDEIGSIARTTLTTVTETLHDRGTELKEDIAASVEGIVQGIEDSKRQLIARESDNTPEASPRWKAAIDEAIDDPGDREEVARLQQEYASLKTRLAIVRANLAERYGYGSEEIKKHLDEAREWYENARDNPEIVTEPIARKHRDFEEKLAEAGTSVARKEREIKQQLRDLWQAIGELFDRGKSEQ